MYHIKGAKIVCANSRNVYVSNRNVSYRAGLPSTSPLTPFSVYRVVRARVLVRVRVRVRVRLLV